MNTQIPLQKSEKNIRGTQTMPKVSKKDLKMIPGRDLLQVFKHLKLSGTNWNQMLSK